MDNSVSECVFVLYCFVVLSVLLLSSFPLTFFNYRPLFERKSSSISLSSRSRDYSNAKRYEKRASTKFSLFRTNSEDSLKYRALSFRNTFFFLLFRVRRRETFAFVISRRRHAGNYLNWAVPSRLVRYRNVVTAICVPFPCLSFVSSLLLIRLRSRPVSCFVIPIAGDVRWAFTTANDAD